MRFYLDEHMPLKEFSHRLRRKGHSSKHVVRLGFRDRDDAFHYQFARAEKRILITQDMDFADP
jgi:predicted nuclease of predicted toxin-antitoxin system